MLSLKPFDLHLIHEAFQLSLQADMRFLDDETVELSFKWTDADNEIIFSDEPSNSRQMGLWQQTCFELFLKPVGQKKYYEFNLNTRRAWNVFEFQDYREPQPPKELQSAQLVQFDLQKNERGGVLKAVFHLPGLVKTSAQVSFCAVLVTKKYGTTYWSFKHADQKPNFHHFDSFIIERSYNSERPAT